MCEDDLKPREVTLTLSGPVAARLDLEAEDEGVTVREWIERAIDLRIMRVDRELSRSVGCEETIELPDRLYRRAWLRWQRAQRAGKDTAFAEYASEYVRTDAEYVRGGE